MRYFKKGNKYDPLDEEIAAAEFLAERTSAKIYIRGANQKGADFLMNGRKYELYSPKKKTGKYGVSREIRDKVGRQGDGRIVVDARNSKLEDFELFFAIEHAIAQGANIVEVVIINKTGRILYWM